MAVTRIVPDLPVTDVGRSNALYAELFELQIGMDQGWVGNLGRADAREVQLQVMTIDASASCNPAISVGVDDAADLDAVYARVERAGLEIVHPRTDETWGVYRFFFRDPDGNVINVVTHR